MAINNKQSTLHGAKNSYYPYILIVGGIIGIVAAFYLSMEKLHLLENPNAQLMCNLNPLLSCGSVILSKQAAAFGFPNPYLGLAAFAVLVTVGMSMLAGATFKRWFWQGLQVGTTFGVLFVHWLFYNSVYVIGKLCIFCMAVWVVTITIFWYTTLQNLDNGVLKLPSKWHKLKVFVKSNHFNILVVWFLVLIVLAVSNFWYYIKTL